MRTPKNKKSVSVGLGVRTYSLYSNSPSRWLNECEDILPALKLTHTLA